MGLCLREDPAWEGTNLHAYVFNNPVNETDKTGMIAEFNGQNSAGGWLGSSSGGSSSQAPGLWNTPLPKLTGAGGLSFNNGSVYNSTVTSTSGIFDNLWNYTTDAANYVSTAVGDFALHTLGGFEDVQVPWAHPGGPSSYAGVAGRIVGRTAGLAASLLEIIGGGGISGAAAIEEGGSAGVLTPVAAPQFATGVAISSYGATTLVNAFKPLNYTLKSEDGESSRQQLRDPKTGRYVPDPENPRSPYAEMTDAERRTHWKRIAEDPNSRLTSAQRQEVIQRGYRGPQQFNRETGQWETMELSHEPVPRREGGTEVVPRWPDEHAAIDPYRQLKK